jgi:hypothetical protein
MAWVSNECGAFGVRSDRVPDRSWPRFWCSYPAVIYFTNKNQNPIHFILLAIIGLLLVLPFIAVVSETVRGNPQDADIWMIFTLTGMIGLAAFANLIKNLVQ